MDLAQLLGQRMGDFPQRRNIFISYHHGNDQGYYDYFSKCFCGEYSPVTDNSLERAIGSDDAEYTMQRIRDNYIGGTSATFVLCGAETYKRKYVDWEIKATLDKEHGLIQVVLPTIARSGDGQSILVPGRLNSNYKSGYAVVTQWTQLSAQMVRSLVEQSLLRDKARIVNDSQLKLRNDP